MYIYNNTRVYTYIYIMYGDEGKKESGAQVYIGILVIYAIYKTRIHTRIAHKLCIMCATEVKNPIHSS